MGYEINDETLKILMNDAEKNDASKFPSQAQYALLLYNILPDKIEGMAGSWLGKDYTGLMDIMDLYQIDKNDRLIIFELLQELIAEASKYYSDKQKKDMDRANRK